jgi:hypothetical protein
MLRTTLSKVAITTIAFSSFAAYADINPADYTVDYSGPYFGLDVGAIAKSFKFGNGVSDTNWGPMGVVKGGWALDPTLLGGIPLTVEAAVNFGYGLERAAVAGATASDPDVSPAEPSTYNIIPHVLFKSAVSFSEEFEGFLGLGAGWMGQKATANGADWFHSFAVVGQLGISFRINEDFTLSGSVKGIYPPFGDETKKPSTLLVGAVGFQYNFS